VLNEVSEQQIPELGQQLANLIKKSLEESPKQSEAQEDQKV